MDSVSNGYILDIGRIWKKVNTCESLLQVECLVFLSSFTIYHTVSDVTAFRVNEMYLTFDSEFIKGQLH